MQHIRLRGISGETEGRSWETGTRLRIGRLEALEIFLDDSSVSRRHAEVRFTKPGWRLRDMGSTNGTFLNGTRLGGGEWPLRAHDIIRCGNITLVVDVLRDVEGTPPASVTPPSVVLYNPKTTLPAPPDPLVVEHAVAASWEDALSGLAYDRNRSPRPGEQLLALLRAGHHLGHHENVDDLLRLVLDDAVATLDAQRGAIVLAEGPGEVLRLRALASNTRNEIASRHCFSQNLAQRCFQRGESILCRNVDDDPELAVARSIAEGAMESVLCVLLRTPRRRLGVLHLDRGPLQKPFSGDDLFLADALAASVSAGIESAYLLQKQRELFQKTILTLAQSVELRDPYTGGHTARVTTYSLLLADRLQLSSSDVDLIRTGTPLHDLGKIGIDDAILRKPGKLTVEEFDAMKQHTVMGANILATIPDLAPIIPIARSHHERWDGRGYPDGLAGEQINHLARIVAVADAFDAMTSDRPYRKGMPADAAFAEVERQRGLQFDPEYAAAFLSIREKVAQEMYPCTARMVALAPGETLPV